MLGALILLVSLEPLARADACLGGGGPPERTDAAPRIGLHQPRDKRPLRFAGGGLAFVGALGSVWLVARKKDRRPPGE
jgi:hypothetical protein